MTFVITELCQGTCDTSCMEVCPVDCIHGPLSVDEINDLHAAGDQARLDEIQLYIDPAICIDCGACVPECPVEAIFDEFDLPDKYDDDLQANADFFE